MPEPQNVVDHELLIARENFADGDLSGLEEQIGERLLLASEDGSGTYLCKVKGVRDSPGGLPFVEVMVELDAELARHLRSGEKRMTVQLQGYAVPRRSDGHGGT